MVVFRVSSANCANVALTFAATPQMDWVTPLFPPETEPVFSPVPLSETAVQTPPPSIAQEPSPAFGQIDPQPSRHAQPFPRARARAAHTTDVMLAVGGNFIAPHSSLTAGSEPRTLTVTHAISAVGALHQQFHPALGYRITASYSRPDFNYTYSASSSGGGFSSGGEINSRIFELAGTYVILGPHRRRLSTSADAGAGLLAFLPTEVNSPASYGYRPAGIVGFNVDYALTRHWGARLAYRAQVFRTPDFRYGGPVPVVTSVTVSNEPSLGITYRFNKNQR